MLGIVLALLSSLGSAGDGAVFLDGKDLRAGFDEASGAADRLEGRAGKDRRSWLKGPVRLQVKNEVTGEAGDPALQAFQARVGKVAVLRRIAGLSLQIDEEWSPSPSGLRWDLRFSGGGKAAGHEVVLELPVLSEALRIFTPGERGTMLLSAYPTFAPAAYGSNGWNTGRSYVLPLVSVLDPGSGSALTVALPPDANIPHLQVEWTDARLLRLRLAHRGMGAERKSELTVLFYAHNADPRSALRAYSDEFPRYFRPGLPRGPHEGAFWYHHIHDHPDFDEMARQEVRFIWMSFWFDYLGEYLPAKKEWRPYTFARWWKLGQTMSDEKIRSFLAEMRGRGIGTFAYFNLTEYGGSGGEKGDTSAADLALKERFAPAMIRNEQGDPIPTWEGAMAMNPGPAYPFFAHLADQLQRHLDRLGEIDGFCVDRLDWASGYDHGHKDGLTMIGEREAENLAVPVARSLQEVCRMAHAAGKRVLANQFYRIEFLKDVDGYCHEMDYPRGLGYLSPFRPAAAWHQAKRYDGDLLAFEGQLMCRLHFALFPQMIAHRFPISQQAPDPEAANLLEAYAPLFRLLEGKEEVLLPRCAEVTGANLVRLYMDRARRYVAPVTSRVRFFSRGGGPEEEASLYLRVPDGRELSWAQVHPLGSPPRKARIEHEGEAVRIDFPGHMTASVVLAGKGTEPPIDGASAQAASEALERLFPGLRRPPKPAGERQGSPAAIPGLAAKALMVKGTHLEAQGKVWLKFQGKDLGELGDGGGKFSLEAPSLEPSGAAPVLEVATGDEGTWFAVEKAELLAGSPDGRTFRVARWLPASGEVAGFGPFELRLALGACAPEEITPSKASFQGKDRETAGAWKGKYGSREAWIPASPGPEEGKGYRIEIVEGKLHIWAEGSSDPRALQPRTAAGPSSERARRSACWFADPAVRFSIVPPDQEPYRLSIYLLDFDRNGRVLEAKVSCETGPLDARRASREETAGGVYLSWIAAGPVDIQVEKVEGFNAVVSGVFIDPKGE